MLLHKLDNIDDPFDGADYITELKLDGIRLLIVKGTDSYRLYTRHGTDVTARFPELYDFAVSLPANTTVDGELVQVDPTTGAPDFEALMARFRVTNATKIATAVKDAPVTYYPFDIVVPRVPLLERKRQLTELLAVQAPHIEEVRYYHGIAAEYNDAVKGYGLEGIVVKRADSTYQKNKRSRDWLKHVNYAQEDVYVTGYRTDGDFGWLLAFENGKPAGIMELGVPTAARHAVYRASKTEGGDGVARLDEPIHCRVKYRNLTLNDYLRLPSFVTFL